MSSGELFQLNIPKEVRDKVFDDEEPNTAEIEFNPEPSEFSDWAGKTITNAKFVKDPEHKNQKVEISFKDYPNPVIVDCTMDEEDRLHEYLKYGSVDSDEPCTEYNFQN